MKLSVLALDYDGTIARGDALDPSVRAAIACARTNGIVTLLVTGRILAELERVAGQLRFVDGVVAENGAVIHFPDSGHTSTLAPPVSEVFLAELKRRGIRHTAGRCLVEANADQALRILDIVHKLELPLVLIFNGGRVMTLPQGISKGTGLHVALDTLRLSPRNALAIGDRENDHEMLRLAEVGVAVEWGSAALRQTADITLTGDGPSAVAAYVAETAARGQLPAAPRARRRLRLGYTEDGNEFSLAVRGRNVLIAGDAKSGKSWVAGLLCEQLILHGYCVCILDPEGDYHSLEGLPGVTTVGGEDPPPTPRELLRVFRYPDRSIVIDLSHQPHDEKMQYIRAVLPALNVMRRSTGLPHRIVVDEAHYFLHDDDAHHLLDLDANGYTVVTYCASRLPKALLAASEVMIVTCESNPAEARALRQCCAKCGAIDDAKWAAIGHLKVGQAVALPITEEAGGDLRMFNIGPRIIPHVRHRDKYVDVPVMDAKAFVFGARRARTLREFVTEMAAQPLPALEGFLRRGDFSRWIADVFGDHALAAETRAFEERHRTAPRDDTVTDIVEAVRARYHLVDDEQVEPELRTA